MRVELLQDIRLEKFTESEDLPVVQADKTAAALES